MPEQEVPSITKVFVNEQKQATIQCPACTKARIIDASHLINTHKRLKVRCKCGHVFKCQLEFREYFRKEVNLYGRYVHKRKGFRGEVNVKNISMAGIGFDCLKAHQIKPGDLLEVHFTLTDANQSRVSLDVAVRSVRDHYIGAQRTDMEITKSALGYYLR